jgi:hypothetical protein
MARCSSGLERDVQEFGRSFALFKAFRNDSEGQGLYAGHRFVPVGTVAHHARQGRHLGDPAPVIFALDLYRKNHVEYCTIRARCLTSEWSRRARRPCTKTTSAARGSFASVRRTEQTAWLSGFIARPGIVQRRSSFPDSTGRPRGSIEGHRVKQQFGKPVVPCGHVRRVRRPVTSSTWVI